LTTTARLVLAATLAAALAGLTPGRAEAQKRPQPACGIQYLPLVENNLWVYEPMASPPPQNEDEKKRLLVLERESSKPPKRIEIQVLSVVPPAKGATGPTEITLRETVFEQNEQKVELKTVLRCTDKSLELAPDSFFFAGEPGGGLLMELSNLAWEGSFPGRQGLRRAEKRTIKLRADVTRRGTEGTGATLTGGKIELEREITIGLKETIATASGAYKNAVAVWMVTSGRAAVGPALDKNVEIRLGENGILWFEDRVGLVQVKNRSGQWFQLVEKKLN
jgi:hypothetical protein